MQSADVEADWRPPGHCALALRRRFHFDELAALEKVAEELAMSLQPGAVVGFSGSLGSGKTTMIRALCRKLQVVYASEVTSPTYALLHEYARREGGTLCHLDLYRLENLEAACALGLDEQIGRTDAITFIEWADKLPSLMPADAIWVRLVLGPAKQRRGAIFSPAATL